MDTMTLIGVAISLVSLVGLSVYTGMKKSKGTGGLSVAVTTGLLMGTIVGGSSTVGTAQLAFNYGMSACWFTFGCAIACLVLALMFYDPIKRSGRSTLVGIIDGEYGERAGTLATVLNSVGMFINILSQLLSCSAVVLVVFPGTPGPVAIAAGGVFMIIYVVFGGTKGAGIVGILKTVLIYVAMVSCARIAISQSGGMPAFMSYVEGLSAQMGRNLFSPFGRGLGTDLGAGISLVLGVITTQTYTQAMLASRTDRGAKISALLCALMMPPLGLMGIAVGLHMRSLVPDPSTFVTRTALTSFILDYSGMHPLLAGIILGALFITAVGTGAGLALGIATVVDREIISKRRPSLAGKTVSPGIAAVVTVATLLSCTPIGDTILSFGFLSMCLRGCTVFAPLCFALWAKGKIPGRYAEISITAGSLIALALGLANMYGIIKLPCDSVFFGIGAGMIVMLLGLKKQRS